jgi:hypothetical protein
VGRVKVKPFLHGFKCMGSDNVVTEVGRGEMDDVVVKTYAGGFLYGIYFTYR